MRTFLFHAYEGVVYSFHFFIWQFRLANVAPPFSLTTFRIRAGALKRRVTRVGTSPRGVPLYTFRYVGDPTGALYRGTIAQELLRTPQHAAAVVALPSGQLAVDYAALGLADKVRFAGQIEDPEAFYQAADIFVLSSLYEGMSNALMEAMAHGLAVVATDVTGTRDLIRPDRDGVIVPAADPPALAAALCELADDATRRASLGGAAQERIRDFDAATQVHLMACLDYLFFETRLRRPGAARGKITLLTGEDLHVSDEGPWWFTKTDNGTCPLRPHHTSGP